MRYMMPMVQRYRFSRAGNNVPTARINAGSIKTTPVDIMALACMPVCFRYLMPIKYTTDNITKSLNGMNTPMY